MTERINNIINLTNGETLPPTVETRGFPRQYFYENAEDPKDWFKDNELAYLLETVEMELINIYPLFKNY